MSNQLSLPFPMAPTPPKTVLTIIVTEDLIVRAEVTLDQPTPEMLAKILIAARESLGNGVVAAVETYGQPFVDAWYREDKIIKESHAR